MRQLAQSVGARSAPALLDVTGEVAAEKLQRIVFQWRITAAKLSRDGAEILAEGPVILLRNAEQVRNDLGLCAARRLRGGGTPARVLLCEDSGGGRVVVKVLHAGAWSVDGHDLTSFLRKPQQTLRSNSCRRARNVRVGPFHRTEDRRSRACRKR